MATIREEKPVGRDIRKDKKKVLTKEGYKKVDREKNLMEMQRQELILKKSN